MTIAIALFVLGIALLIVSRQNAAQKGLFRPGMVLIGLATLAYVAASAIVVVPAGRAGVVFNNFSGVKPGALAEGYNLLIPGLESVVLYDARQQELTLSRRGEDGPDVDESIVARSKEGLEISADVTVQFRIKREEVAQLHRELGPTYIKAVIRPQIRSKVRDAIGQFGAADLISTGRSELEARVTDNLREVFSKSHLELVSVLLRELRIPQSVAKAIEEKQTAEQQVAIENNRLRQSRIAAQRKVAEAQGESEAAVARARGEAQALRLRGEALKGNPQLIQLTIAEKLAPTIQTVVLPSNGNFIMGLDNLLKNNSSQPAPTPKP